MSALIFIHQLSWRYRSSCRNHSILDYNGEQLMENSLENATQICPYHPSCRLKNVFFGSLFNQIIWAISVLYRNTFDSLSTALFTQFWIPWICTVEFNAPKVFRKKSIATYFGRFGNQNVKRFLALITSLKK